MALTVKPSSLPEPPPPPEGGAVASGSAASGAGASFPIVVGASAGGLEAFPQLLVALPADTGMAFVLVQHLAATHASALAEILSRATKLPVMEVRGEPMVEPNRVYVIPPGQDMVIAHRPALEDVTGRKVEMEATARLAAIVSSSEDAIISKDLDGIITSWNEGATRLFGYSAEEIIGRPVEVLIPEDSLDEEPIILERIRRGEVIDHYETARRRKDGSLIHISLTVSPVRDGAGRILGASKIARDITERKRADEERRASHARLQAHTEELSWFNRAAVGRELRMIELKREINELCQRFGEAARYPLEFDREE